ncbi:MAG: hypothetical protein L0Y58_11480 [Verrucomicrobia subdivision 3 bacterium]|nr:hypothetical protein [Limisphaerales bacterium]
MLALLSALAGCKKEEIRVYVAPKEKPAPTRTAAHDSGPRPHAHYTVPGGWTEVEPGAMRSARFSVPGSVGNLDVSILPLPGVTAGQLDIVNLWREQVRLEAVSESDLGGLAEKVRIGEKEGELFDMVSNDPMIEDKHKARILVAMVKDGDTSWFIKMTGEDESVRQQKPVFTDFLRSISFDYSAHGTEVAKTAAPGAEVKPAWAVPKNWKEVEPTQMVLAKFIASGQGDAKAEITVSVFPGDVGGVHANVNRWRGQIGLPAASDSEMKSIIQPLDAPGGGAILVDMSGENLGTKARTRLIGAIVPDGGRTWFYKMMGADAVAEAEKPALIRFIQSAKHSNNG